MSTSTPQIDRTPSAQAIEWKWLGLPVLLYVFSVLLTHPPFIGDTPLYIGQIGQAHGFGSRDLWEFGHILWRPIGFLLFPILTRIVPDSVAWSPELKIAYGLTGLNLLCGLISTVLIYDLGRRLIKNPLWAMVPVFVFVWGDAFLSYSQSGVSYVPALTAMLGGLWLQICVRTMSPRVLLGSAGLLGLACLLWFPFVFVLPAAVCARKLTGLRGAEAWNWMQILSTLVITGAIVGGGVMMAALMAGVHSLAGFRLWMSASSHELHQNRQWLRAISGCPRLLIDLGHDGMYLKRFTFKDPYNPVSAVAIVRLMLWKIGLFYLFAASVVVLAWTSVQARPALALAILAGLPLLLFSVLVFEPSAPERFLPVLPFILFALAAGWTSGHVAAKWARGVICFFVLMLPMMNWPTFAGSFSREVQQAHARLDDFRKAAAPDDVLLTISLQDPVIQLLDQNLFDAANRQAPLRNHWLLNVAAANVSLWRQQFAALVLDNWRENRQVWVTKGVLDNRPDPNTFWVEGDNPVVHWNDIPSFFKTLDFDQQTARSDGFLRVHRTPQMEERFSELSAELPHEGVTKVGR